MIRTFHKACEIQFIPDFYFLPVQYAQRYSFPRGASLKAHPDEDPYDDVQNGTDICTNGPSSSTVENAPNIERKDRYAFKDILVEDLDIETSDVPQSSGNLFEEMCLRRSVDLSQSQDFSYSDENNTTGNLQSKSKRNDVLQTQRKQTEPLERHPSTVHEASTVNKSESRSIKLKTFFKLTL